MKRTSIAALTAAAALAGTGAGFLGFSALTDPPQQSDYAVEQTVGTFTTTVHNPDGVLSAEEEERLRTEAEQVQAPEVVTQLHYLVFAKNDENVNDTVEKYLRDNAPELIAPDDDHFADGALIVGVGLDPRQAFTFAGEDVANTLSLHEGRHLDATLDAIKPGVKDGDIPAGLLSGARTATDQEGAANDAYEQAESDHTLGQAFSSLGTGGLAGGAALWAGVAARSRRKKAEQAREDFQVATREYTELSQRLDHIDIRAHSLTSPLVDDTLRGQWAEVQQRFLTMHDRVGSLGELSQDAPDKAFLHRADELGEAAEVTRQVSYAEENIDTLFRLEQGDTAVREQEVSALHSDILAARLDLDTTSSPLYVHLTEVKERAEQLTRRTDSPTFVQDFFVLLRDYQSALTEIRKQKFSDVEPAEELRAPRLYDRDYRPGYGVSGFVPYWSMAAWHSNNVSAHEASQSNTNSSFSSGFSGAGGSSGF